MLCSLDVLVFVMIASLTGLTAEQFGNVKSGSSAGFTFVTDGICLILFMIRLYYAFRYVNSVLLPPQMDYQYIIEFGKLKWHTKRVKKMRIHFKNYTLASNVSSVFIFIQTGVLLIALWRDQQLYFRYCFLLLLSVFTMINLGTIYAHLKELDDQVTYRIRICKKAILAAEAKKSGELANQGNPQKKGIFTLYEAPSINEAE